MEIAVTHERIEINPEIMGGKPVIRGTRVPVEIVLRKLGAGMTPEAIIGDHPRLTHDDIRAAQAFAADYLARFTLRAALPRAKAKIAKAEKLKLSGRDSLRVLDLLENPSALPERLLRAARAGFILE
jgi:uncharacterized protein (DUF433 family)